MHLERARLYLDKSDTDTALADLQTALQQNPALVSAREMLADVHLRRGEVEQAREALRTTIEQAPASKEARLRLADLLAQEGTYDQAEAVLREGQTLFSSDPTWSVRLANIALRQGDRKAALPHLKQAVKLAPTAPHLGDLARLYLAMQDPQAALAVFHDHASVTNQEPTLQALRGRARCTRPGG